MAFEARVICDYPMANQALTLAEEAVYHVVRVIRKAQNTENPQLGFSAYNACSQIEAVVDNIISIAQQIDAKSSEPIVVHAPNFLLEGRSGECRPKLGGSGTRLDVHCLPSIQKC